MKKLTGIICGIMLLAGSSLFAEGPVAAGNLELGIGKIVSYDRLWDSDNTYNTFKIGTFTNVSNTYSMGNTAYGLYPVFTFSYFVADGLGLGFNGGYSYLKESNEDDPETYWFVAPEIKLYVPVAEGLLVDAHGSVGFNGRDSGTTKYDSIYFGLGLGLDVLLTEQFAVVIGVDYTYNLDYNRDGETVEDTAYSTIGVSLGFKTFLSMMN